MVVNDIILDLNAGQRQLYLREVQYIPISKHAIGR